MKKPRGFSDCIFVFALVFVVAPLLSLSAQNRLESDWCDVADEIRPLVTRLMEEGAVTGLSLVLVDGDRLVWAEGFGLADAAAGKRAAAHGGLSTSRKRIS